MSVSPRDGRQGPERSDLVASVHKSRFDATAMVAPVESMTWRAILSRLSRAMAFILVALVDLRAAHASGMGDLGPGLHGAYVYGFVPVGLAVPEYSLRADGDGARSGLQWEVPFIFGARDLDPPVWGGGTSISWYPGHGDVMLRGTGRVIVPLRSSDESWKTEVPGISLGVGGFWHDRGYGPRVEARIRYWFWAGFFLSAAWEPTVSPAIGHGGEVAAGLELPILVGL